MKQCHDARVPYFVLVCAILLAWLASIAACRQEKSRLPVKPDPVATRSQDLPVRDRVPEAESMSAPLSSGPEDNPSTLVNTHREEAIRVAEQLTAAFPDDPNAYSVMAMAYHRFGKMTESVKWLEKCLQLDPNFSDAFHGLGSVALKKGDYTRAAALLRKALQADPNLPGARDQLAEALLASGRFEEAIAVLSEDLDEASSSPERYARLGAAYLQCDQFENAKRSYEQAIEIDSTYTDAYYGLAQACEKLNQHDVSREALEEFRKRRGRDHRDRVGRANKFHDLGYLYQAVADVYTAAAMVYYRHGAPEQAESHWNKAADYDPTDPVCRRQLLTLYQQKGDTESMLPVLEDLATIDPQDAATQLDLGVVNLQLKHVEAAEDAFTNVKRLLPERSEGYLALARLYLLTDQKSAEAQTLMKTVVDLERTPSNCALLSAACRKNGDLVGAKSAIEQAIQLDPGNQEYKQIRDLLAEEK